MASKMYTLALVDIWTMESRSRLLFNEVRATVDSVSIPITSDEKTSLIAYSIFASVTMITSVSFIPKSLKDRYLLGLEGSKRLVLNSFSTNFLTLFISFLISFGRNLAMAGVRCTIEATYVID